MERPTKAQTLRVFFALVPDAATQALLDVLARDVAARAGGRAIVGANIHLTLAFVGDVDPDRIDVLREIAIALPRDAFVLTLGRVALLASIADNGGVCYRELTGLALVETPAP